MTTATTIIELTAVVAVEPLRDGAAVQRHACGLFSTDVTALQWIRESLSVGAVERFGVHDADDTLLYLLARRLLVDVGRADAAVTVIDHHGDVVGEYLEPPGTASSFYDRAPERYRFHAGQLVAVVHDRCYRIGIVCNVPPSQTTGADPADDAYLVDFADHVEGDQLQPHAHVHDALLFEPAPATVSETVRSGCRRAYERYRNER